MNGMENRWHGVNMKKTKFMISGARLDKLRNSHAFPCNVCQVKWKQTLLAIPSANCGSI